jgi:hypothetical protein
LYDTAVFREPGAVLRHGGGIEDFVNVAKEPVGSLGTYKSVSLDQ